jgi:hypothetical protein
MTSGVTAGGNLSCNEAFDTRVSADIKVRFGGASTTAQRKEVQQLPVISALTSTLSNRIVRVHDAYSVKLISKTAAKAEVGAAISGAGGGAVAGAAVGGVGAIPGALGGALQGGFLGLTAGLVTGAIDCLD